MMSPGPKRRIPSEAELSEMPGFQRKLHRYVGERPVASLAREIGVEPSTLQRWLSGQSPALSALRKLAEGTGVPVAYWADDAIPPRDHGEPGGRPGGQARGKTGAGQQRRARVGPVAAAKGAERGRERPDGPPEAIGLDAADPRALEVRGDSLLPFAADGEVVVFDAGAPGRVREGEFVVVALRGAPGEELAVRRRQTTGDSVVYLAPAAGVPPVVVPRAEAGAEYPIVALIKRPRREVRTGVAEADAGYAAEDAGPYGAGT